MRIKIAILDQDVNYLEHLSATFGNKYGRNVEVYSFTEMEKALSIITEKRIDVFLASDAFEINVKNLPKRCGFAYFVEDNDTESINDQPAVSKFQKAEQIYKQILGIYSEHSSSFSSKKNSEGNGQLIIFTSPCGGTGTSTAAAACAVGEAVKGKKVLYLNFETFGGADSFFYADGSLGMSEIIYALKSKKSNLPLKLESCVKQDNSGVYFFSAPALALDSMELKEEEIIELIDAINMSTDFDVIVMDKEFSLDKTSIKLMQKAEQIVWVSDGEEISNVKVQRAFAAFASLEQSLDEPLSYKTYMLYNKFSNKTGIVLDNIGFNLLGGVPRFEHATTVQVLQQITVMNVFEALFSQEIM